MISTKSKRKKTRTGKTGTIRLGKKDMEATRKEVYLRAAGYCQLREILVEELAGNTEMELGHRLAAIEGIESKCWRWASEANGHDVHLRTKRNHGDGLDNRVWGCRPCHLEADHNAYGKPCPPKVKA